MKKVKRVLRVLWYMVAILLGKRSVESKNGKEIVKAAALLRPIMGRSIIYSWMIDGEEIETLWFEGEPEVTKEDAKKQKEGCR